ncbi:MAG: hypothetical protein HYU88_13325, partial [Chloroflexi bacterium]|nr:hypothetical protein [Chloroflexota bacterium]
MVTWGKRAAFVAAVAVVALGLAAVLARPAFADPPGPAGAMQRFIAKLAANLGIGEEQLQGAIKTTRLQLVDEAVAEGRLSAEQAERARQRIEQGKGFGPMFGPGGPGAHRGGPRGRGPGAERPQGIPGVGGAGFDAVAQLLGVTPPQLRDELRGKTLAEVSQAHGKSRDEVGQAYLNGLRTALDQAVANGRLTRERADAMIQRAQESLNSLLDRRAPERAPGPRGERGPAIGGAGFSAVAQLLGVTPP